jgi:threonine/homoserine/homoserine lactone efflux protein
VALANPMPILAVILMLVSPRARTAPVFLVGWVVGMLVVFGILLFVISPEPALGSEHEPTALASIVRIVIGGALLFLAVRQWQKRPRPSEAGELPAWIANLQQTSPAAALGLGALLSALNPKNLAFTIAAGVAIAQADLAAAEALVPVTVFVLIASAGVAAPVIWHVVAPERASATLTGWSAWLATNYATVMAVVMVLFGVILVSRGLGDLIG